MKFNFLQQLGVVLVVIGGVLLAIYSQPTLPEFSYGSGVITFRDIPDWLPSGALIAGIATLIVGTAWNIVSGRVNKSSDDDDDEE